MSQLFDALRRGRPRAAPPQHADRTERADAVLATLGYRKKSPPSVARPIVFGLAGLVAALAVAWSLWPRQTARRPQPPAAVQNQPSSLPVGPPGAVSRASTPGPASQPATTEAPRPADAPLVSTRPPETVVPPAIPPAGTPAPTARGLSVAVSPPAARPQRPAAPPLSAAAAPEHATTPAGSASSGAAVVPPVAAPPPVSSAELFRLAVYHHRAGDFVAAETSYRALLQRNELDAQVHNNLGLLYRDKGLIDEALREFQRALLVNPQYLTARNNLGVVLMGSSRLEDAAAEFHRILTADPRNIDASVNLALVEKASGRPEQAKESLLRALGIDPRNAPAHFNLASLYEQSGETVRAVEHYRSFLEHAGAEHAVRAPDARARIDALARSR